MPKKIKHDKELSFLIKEYFKIKYLSERLYGQKLRLRAEIIDLMKKKGLDNYDNKYFRATLFEVKETRIDIEKVKKIIPPEQVKLLETSTIYPVLRVLPKNEEKVIKEVMRELKKW
jgi:hypothetical protein